MREDVVDGFGGPGGWDIAACELGLDPLGIEWDDAACATRAAAGLRTLQADMAALDPRAFAPLWGGIFSPPCQAFSMAGKGEGRRALAAYIDAIHKMAEGRSYEHIRADVDDACRDPRAHLVLEPLRWAMALRPRWLALEQVETVLPLWEEMARVLRLLGYSVWTGVLSAEMYGVPQTRRRAILIASLDRKVGCPPPTHARYVPPRRAATDHEPLFDAGEQKRIVLPEDEHLRPWISMAEALGWDEHDLVGFPRRNDREDGGDYRERDLREASEPAFNLTEKTRSWQRWVFRATNDRPNATARALDEPAPALAFGHNPPRWVFECPATNVNCDPRISRPGHHDENRSGDQQRDAVRVTIKEAAVLQSFPATTRGRARRPSSSSSAATRSRRAWRAVLAEVLP